MVVLITAFYVGSVVDPLVNLHGLPVAVVNQDRGAMIGAQRINIGQEVQRGLSDSTAVSGRLALTDTTLSSAEQAMDRGASYAAVVIPPGLAAASRQIGQQLTPLVPAARASDPLTRAFLADPVNIEHGPVPAAAPCP